MGRGEKKGKGKKYSNKIKIKKNNKKKKKKKKNPTATTIRRGLIGGAGMARERPPPTIVAWVRFRLSVICGLSLLLFLALFFSGLCGFTPSTKTNTPNSNSTADMASSINIAIYSYF